MDSSHLTRAQLESLIQTVGRHLRYQQKLLDRMQQQRWPLNDSLYQATLRARDLYQKLHDEARVLLHSRTGKAAD